MPMQRFCFQSGFFPKTNVPAWCAIQKESMSWLILFLRYVSVRPAVSGTIGSQIRLLAFLQLERLVRHTIAAKFSVPKSTAQMFGISLSLSGLDSSSVRQSRNLPQYWLMVKYPCVNITGWMQPRKETTKNNYYTFSKVHHCINWQDYVSARLEPEECDELCHGNWIEIDFL